MGQRRIFASNLRGYDTDIPLPVADHPIFGGLAKLSKDAAPYIALLFLIPAPFAFFNTTRKRKRLDIQTSIESIRQLDWKAFEELVSEAYRREGYHVIENSSAGPDGGVDIRLKRDGQLHVVQCKHWQTQNIGVRVVREIYGVMVSEEASSAIIVTSGEFTNEALKFSDVKPITLINGGALLRLIGDVQGKQQGIKHPSAMRCPRCSGGIGG